MLQSFADDAQRAQRQQVDLDQPGVFDALLVPLADNAAGHGGRFQGHDLIQGRAGDQHAAGMDGEMARAAVDLAQEFGQQRQGMGSSARNWRGVQRTPRLYG